MNKFISICLIALFITGCTSLRKLDSTAQRPSNEESIFVIGIEPEYARVGIFRGHVSKGKFTQNPFLPVAVLGNPDNGFLVGKAKAGQTLAITNVRLADKSSIMGTNFRPCNGGKTIVFTIPQGKIIYIGNIFYAFNGKQISINTSNNFADAQAFLNRNYPNLKGTLEAHSYQLLPTTESCVQNIYVPVYLPQSK